MKFFVPVMCVAFVIGTAYAADDMVLPFSAVDETVNQDMNADEYQAAAQLQMELINSEFDEIAAAVR